MKKYPSSSTLTVGFILITLGVIFLVENFYAPFSAWRLLSQYWPVILIIIGLNKICAYFLRQKEEQPEVSDKTDEKKRVPQKRYPSLSGALLWTGLGVLFLLSNLGIVPDALDLTLRYWPLLLILLGAGKVIDYFLRKDSVSLHFGEFVGIVLLLVAGIFIIKISESNMGRFLRQVPIKIGNVAVYPGGWIGNSHTYTKEAVFPLGGSSTVRINHSRGKITVNPGSDGEVRVRLKNEVYADESRAFDISEKLLIEGEYEPSSQSVSPSVSDAASTQVSDNLFVIKINDDALENTNYRIDSDLEVFIPVESNLQVENSFGAVQVAGINGKLDLSNTHQPLEVRDCEGEFDISSDYGECLLVNLTGNLNLESSSRVYLESLKGNADINAKHSRVDISDVNGKVTVSSTDGDLRIENVSQPVTVEASGKPVRISRLESRLDIVASHNSINVEDVASDISLKSRYANAILKDVKGNVEINSESGQITADTINGSFTMQGNGSGMRVNNIAGKVNIQTSKKDISVNGFSGSCDIANEYADIRVSVQDLDRNEINIKNRNGGINLYLPERADFSMDAVTRQGRIESSYEGLDSPPGTGNVKVLEFNKNSNGARIKLETEYGNIRIFGNSRNRSNGR